jgi:hypothetical protein
MNEPRFENLKEVERSAEDLVKEIYAFKEELEEIDAFVCAQKDKGAEFRRKAWAMHLGEVLNWGRIFKEVEEAKNKGDILAMERIFFNIKTNMDFFRKFLDLDWKPFL